MEIISNTDQPLAQGMTATHEATISPAVDNTRPSTLATLENLHDKVLVQNGVLTLATYEHGESSNSPTIHVSWSSLVSKGLPNTAPENQPN